MRLGRALLRAPRASGPTPQPVAPKARRRAVRSLRRAASLREDPQDPPISAQLPVPGAPDPAERARRAARLRKEMRERVLRLGLVLLVASVVSPTITHVSPTKAYVVASGSMEPTIPTGSLAVAGPGEPQVGDVIVYWSPVGAHQIHRVFEIREINNSTYYFPRGDANDGTDSFAVPAKDVKGVVQRHVPYLGYLWLMPAQTQFLLFGALLAVYLGITLWDARQLFRRSHTGALAALMVLVIMLPTAHGAVAPTYPESPLSANIATTPLPMATGTMASASINADQNGATVTAASPKLWKEIKLWNCDKDSTCVLSINGNGYAEQTGSYWAHIKLADYSPAPTFYFEAYIKAGTGGTTYAILRNKTDGTDVAASEVSTTSTSLTLVRSASFTLTGEKDYTIRTKRATANGELQHARLVLSQDYPTKTVEQIPLMQGDTSLDTSWVVPTRASKWRFDGSSMDGVIGGYFEAVAEVDGNMLTDSLIRLMDRTSATEVARLTVDILDTAATRFRSGNLTFTDGHEYEVEANRGDGLLNDKLKIYVARVLVMQSGFTKTVRYVDLSWTKTTTSAAFTTVGYPGRYHMDSEWGGITGYFEVTMKNSNAGSTSSARLYDDGAGAAVSGSQVDVTGTTRTRARSAAITLNTANVTYAVQLSAAANTAEIRNAWLIVLQEDVKTYDHTLKTRNNVVNACTWTFTLEHTSNSNLARIAKATISIRGDALQDQIKVVSGAVTQTVGTAVSVAYGSDLQHVVATKPTSSGTTTLNAELKGTCAGYGIKTVQPVTYSLT